MRISFFILLFCLIISTPLFSQFYLAGMVSTDIKESSFQFGYQYQRDFILLDNSMIFNLNDYRYNIKLGFRLFRYRAFSFFAYIPYLNYSFTYRGYNTPLYFSIFFKERFSLGCDIYKDRLLLSFKARLFLK
jgi:hypothetical protein